jgi:Bacterial archaeo-eukaryotic release factor family 10
MLFKVIHGGRPLSTSGAVPMVQSINLRELAALSSGERAFLSVYLLAPPALGRLSHRIRTIEHLLSGEADELTQFRENMEPVERYLEKHAHLSGSLVLFSCRLLNVFRPFAVDRPLPDLIWVGSSPYIRPLAEMRDDYETFAVVAADNDKARISLVSTVRTEEEAVIHGHIKNHVKVGGWSQQRYERRRDTSLHHYAREIVDRLVALEKEEKSHRVLLVGSRETISEIEAVLPRDLCDSLVGERTMSLGKGVGYLHQEIFDLIFAEERREREGLWQKIKTRHLRGEPAAVGPEEVLSAARAGRVDRALANRGVKIAGTRCRTCNGVFAGHTENCPSCGSSDTFMVDLVNEIVEHLVLSGAEIEFAEGLLELEKIGGIAALLRY